MLILKKNSILVQEETKSSRLLWYSSDNEEDFKKNKNSKRFPKKYLKNPINYCFNEYGYRTKDFNDTNKDFILIFGCSYTEGVGLYESETWRYKISQKLKIDHISLAKAGTGPDIQYINTVQWIKNKFPKPKLVIYQWPQNFRKSFCYNENNDYVLKHHNVNTKSEKLDTNWYLKRYCVEDGEKYLNNYIAFTNSNLLWNTIGVSVYNWHYDDFENFDNIKPVRVDPLDIARDLGHDGDKMHDQVVDQIIDDVDRLLI